MDLGKLEELTASLRKKGHPEYYILKMRNAFFRKQMDTLEGQKRYWDIWKQVRPKQISTWHYSTLGIPNDSSDEKVNQKNLHHLYTGVENPGSERELLDNLLDALKLEKNSETRFAAYTRIWDLKEDPLRLYLENNETSQWDIESLMETAYTYVKAYHFDIHTDFIETIESENLLPDFYLEVMKWVHEVGKGYSKLFTAWNNHTLNWINRELEDKFENDSEAIMNYLEENNLFDKGHGWIRADRCYSALVKSGDWYVSKAYREAFPEAVSEILASQKQFLRY